MAKGLVMSDFFGLEFLQDDNRLVASIRPVEGRPILDLESLRDLLEQSGYGKWQLLEETLAMLVERYNTATEVVELFLKRTPRGQAA